MKLKLFVINKHSHEDGRGLKTLHAKMVNIYGDPDTIIALGEFLIDCGNEMKSVSPFHRHFRDSFKGWKPDLGDVVLEPIENLKKHTVKRKAKQVKSR